jgi:hypothetical protein
MTALGRSAVRTQKRDQLMGTQHALEFFALGQPLYKNYYHGLPVLQRSSPKVALNSVSGKPRLGLQDLAYTMMHMENP